MDSTSVGAGSSEPNSGECPSSATAPAVVSSYDPLNDFQVFRYGIEIFQPTKDGGGMWVELPHVLLDKAYSFPSVKPLPVSATILSNRMLATILSNEGESSGSGGRAGEERNGGGGDGNEGIGGGVGGGGQREGIGNERRGNRGRNHGGGNGDDDGNDRGGWVGYIEGERRRMGPRSDRMADILLLLDAEIIGTLESLDSRGLSARVRILRVFSLGFASGAFVCLLASIKQRRTNPILASILTWIGSAATFLAFFLMIAMAFSASFIP